MQFATPAALLLALVIPFFVWYGLPRLPYRRRRDTTSLILRLIIVVLVILSLAGLQTTQASDKLAVVFLVDASDSIDAAARAQAEAYLRAALARMSPEDRAGIVVFGRNALVERPVSAAKEFSGIASTPIRLDTNLSEAIRLGLAMFPADAARRLVILSDGVETLGNALEAARLAAALGVQIDIVPLRRTPSPEVMLTELRLPARVNQGEEFDLGITVESSVATPANITVLSRGTLIRSLTVNLQAGVNNFVLSPLRVPQQGFTDLQVRVDPLQAEQTDTFYQNNALAGFVEVSGPPRALIIAKRPEEAQALLPALREAGLTVDIQAPADLPIGVAPLAAYKAVILANVSATELTEQRMRALQAYVRDLGGGLVVIGGPDSYGVGGYYQTPLEETLPVEMQLKDQQRIPRLTIIYVIDRSGSMEVAAPSGVTLLELSKEAARRSINFLFERDRAGVLSFDSNPQWLVPIQFVANRAAIIQQIGALRPGGGTDIYAAMQELLRTLPSDPSTLKHVILLTDGIADERGVVETARALNEQHGVTITAIGVGLGVPPFMQEIARVGKGSYYNLLDVQNIPQIFAAETVLATRSYIVEEPFVPALTANSPIMRGIEAVPPLLGYVATSAKPTATVILSATAQGFNDPLLAAWQYGLGRAVAWTSDATTRWAGAWTEWAGFQRFWSQVIRSTILEGLNSALEMRVEQREGRSVLIVEARDDQGAFLNGLDLSGSLVDPTLSGQTVRLRQVAPGRYEAEFDANREGAYFIRVAGGQGSAEAGLGVAQTAGWVLSYSPEYRLRETDTALLEALAELTGGRNVSDSAERAFRRETSEVRGTASLAPWLLIVALLLLPFDIAVRRVVITPTDLQKLRAWAQKRLGVRLGDQQAEQVHSARLAALKGAKMRASSPPAPPSGGESPAPPISEPSAAEPKAHRAPSVPREAPKPPVVPQPPAQSGALAARLAEKRRQQRKDNN